MKKSSSSSPSFFFFKRSFPFSFSTPPPILLHQVGCGVGNAALPLLDVVPAPAPVYACDFSATAIGILRRSAAAAAPTTQRPGEEGSSSSRLRAFVADAARPGELLRASRGHGFPPIEPGSLAAATLIFALSAMSPAAMVVAVANVKSVLSAEGGRAFVRDYAVGDMASARLAGRSTPRRLHAWLPAAAAGGGVVGGEEDAGKGSGDNACDAGDDANAGDDACARAEAAAALLSGGEFFARGDGTRAFYFSEGGLRRLFESAGFETESIGTGESFEPCSPFFFRVFEFSLFPPSSFLLTKHTKIIQSNKQKPVHMTKENRATREKMPRKWVQAVFRLGGRKDAGDESAARLAAGDSTRLTRTTATTTATTTSEAGGEETAAPPSPLKGTRAFRYRPEWQDSDDDEEEEDEKRNGGEEREANSSASDDDEDDDDEETARAAARLFRTVLVDSTPSSKAAASETPSNSNPTLLGLETHEVDVGSPLGKIAFSAAPSELRSTLSHTGLLSWPAAPALARILLDRELAARYASSSSSSSSSSSLSLLELGAGGSPLVALAAARSGCGFRRVVSTDGSPRALRLLSSNLASNASLVVAERLRVRLLPWGDARAAEEAVAEAGTVAVPAEGAERGGRFGVVVGADTLYSVPALPRLMATIAATLDGDCSASSSSAIAVLCYQERRVRVADAEAAAREAGLEVIDPPPPAWRCAGWGGMQKRCKASTRRWRWRPTI